MSDRRAIKTLSDIQSDMSLLYDQVVDGQVELQTASELANIAGKFLKAEQLKLAREIFSASIRQRSAAVEFSPPHQIETRANGAQ